MELDADRRTAACADLQAEVDSLALPVIERGETPGIAVGVLSRDGRTHFFGYGVKERGGARPDADTLFPIGSVSKGFLGALTALLVGEGVLSWEDSLGSLLPDVALSRDARKITVLQLATHTSGLPRQPNTLRTVRYFIEYLFTGNSFYRHFDRGFALAYLAEFKPEEELEVIYSSLGYGILAYVIERRTGQSLEALMQQRILGPLQLKSTGYSPEVLPGYAARAHGYAGDHPMFMPRGAPVPDWQFTELMKGAAAIHSSARDLLAFAAAHFDSSDAKLRAALKDTLQVRLARPEQSAAVAWVVDDIDGQRIAYQVGLVAGYATYLGLDAERRTAVVVLQNSFNWNFRIGHQLLVRLARADCTQRTLEPAKES